MKCTHVSFLEYQVDKILHIVSNKKLKCENCEEDANIWICLECYEIGCSRYIGAHSKQHWIESDHSTCISLSDGAIFCYQCDDEVYPNDEEIYKLQKTIVDIHVARVQVIEIDSSSTTEEGNSSIVILNQIKEAKCTRGLRNLGNTCYMNAALQCLANLTQFGLSVISINIDPSCTSETNSRKSTRSTRSGRSNAQNPIIAQILSDLVKKLWTNDERSALSPDAFRNAFSKIHESFWGFRQQDAHEFLRVLLCQLESELPIYQSNLAELVSSCFGGKLQSNVVCIQCGSEFEKIDYFCDLSVEIPQQFWDKPKDSSCVEICTLQDCIANFFSLEELTETEWFYCKECNLKQPSAKQFTISKEPSILCIHIKRFRHDRSSKSKIQTHVAFPLGDLDLSSFLITSDEQVSPSKKMKRSLYRLESFVVHHGSTLSSGHYTSFVRANREISQYLQNGELLNATSVTAPKISDVKDRWFHFNDSTVTEASLEAVKKASAYILFYQKL